MKDECTMSWLWPREMITMDKPSMTLHSVQQYSVTNNTGSGHLDLHVIILLNSSYTIKSYFLMNSQQGCLI